MGRPKGGKKRPKRFCKELDADTTDAESPGGDSDGRGGFCLHLRDQCCQVPALTEADEEEARQALALRNGAAFYDITATTGEHATPGLLTVLPDPEEMPSLSLPKTPDAPLVKLLSNSFATTANNTMPSASVVSGPPTEETPEKIVENKECQTEQESLPEKPAEGGFGLQGLDQSTAQLNNEAQEWRGRCMDLQATYDDIRQKLTTAEECVVDLETRLQASEKELARAGWGREQGSSEDAHDVYESTRLLSKLEAVRTAHIDHPLVQSLHKKLLTKLQDLPALHKLSSEAISVRCRQVVASALLEMRGGKAEILAKHEGYNTPHRQVNSSYLPDPEPEGSEPETPQTHRRRMESISSSSSIYSTFSRKSSASFRPGMIEDPAEGMTFDEDIATRHAAAQGMFVQIIEACRLRLQACDKRSNGAPPEDNATALFEKEVHALELKYQERERIVAKRWWQHAKQQYDEKLHYTDMYNTCLSRCKYLEAELESIGNESHVLQDHNRELLDQLTAMQFRDVCTDTAGVTSGPSLRQLKRSDSRGGGGGGGGSKPRPTICSACNSSMIDAEVHFKYLHMKKQRAVVPRPPHKEVKSRVTPHTNLFSMAPALGDHVNDCVQRFLS